RPTAARAGMRSLLSATCYRRAGSPRRCASRGGGRSTRHADSWRRAKGDRGPEERRLLDEPGLLERLRSVVEVVDPHDLPALKCEHHRVLAIDRDAAVAPGGCHVENRDHVLAR